MSSRVLLSLLMRIAVQENPLVHFALSPPHRFSHLDPVLPCHRAKDRWAKDRDRGAESPVRPSQAPGALVRTAAKLATVHRAVVRSSAGRAGQGSHRPRISRAGTSTFRVARGSGIRPWSPSWEGPWREPRGGGSPT